MLKSDNMTEALYARLPVFLQNAACYWYGHKEAAVRLGPAFERYLQEMQESEKWSRGQICAYQDEKVRNLVSYAYHNVPFYHEQMRERRLLPQDIRGTSDLAKLPILTKEDVRANADRLLSTNARRHRLLPRHTSGTTGKCLELYVDPPCSGPCGGGTGCGLGYGSELGMSTSPASPWCHRPSPLHPIGVGICRCIKPSSICSI